jgi:hypothetical protein
MAFLLEVFGRRNTPEEAKKAFADYTSYIQSIRESLPSSAYEFAVAPWHYNYKEHRCPHDSWVESLVISEPSSGSRHEKREIAIAIRLLGAYHDGHLELSYPGVRSYSLSCQTPEASKIGHGDWLIDEVRFSDKHFVLHEILFSTRSRWLIESRDIEFRWVPHS